MIVRRDKTILQDLVVAGRVHMGLGKIVVRVHSALKDGHTFGIYTLSTYALTLRCWSRDCYRGSCKSASFRLQSR